VHAAVGLVPLAALSAVALVALPRARWASRWVALVAALGATGAVVLARSTGEALLRDRAFLTASQSPVRDLVRTHQERAGLLLWATIALAAVVVVAFLALPAPSALASRRYDHVGVEQAWLPPVLMVLLVVVAVFALVAVVLTGDSGARAVWSNG
jgi:hypothetical protein